MRAVGRELGLPDYLVNRQPFPGPGLGIRIIGERAPDILRRRPDRPRELMAAGLDQEIWRGARSSCSPTFVPWVSRVTAAPTAPLIILAPRVLRGCDDGRLDAPALRRPGPHLRASPTRWVNRVALDLQAPATISGSDAHAG